MTDSAKLAALEPEIVLEPRSPGCTVPLTAAQTRYLRGYSDGKGTRLVASAARVLGELDCSALQESIGIVVKRHESLRTRICMESGLPTQLVDPATDYDLEVVDLSRVPASVAETEARSLAQRQTETEVDVRKGPLFKATLLKMPAEQHVLVLAADHLVSDAMSLATVSKEIWLSYQQAVNPVAAALPHLRIQYADYAVWQERTYWPWRQRHESYWQERLSNAPFTQVPIVTDRSSGATRTNATLHIPLGKKASVALREIAAREGTSLPMAVLTIYACVMSYWCAQRDLPLIFITHGRHAHPELKDMVGFLAGSIHLRVEIRPEDGFIDLLKRVSWECKSAFEHYHFDRVWDFIGRADTDLCFNWIHSPSSASTATGSHADNERIRTQSFPLGLSWPGSLHVLFSNTPVGVIATVVYNSDFAQPSIVELLARCLQSFAHEFARAPTTRVDSLSTDIAALARTAERSR
jgi:hypothetical protein